MDADRCVCCGEIVPEGTMVCWNCEHNILDNHNTLTQSKNEIVKPHNNKIFAKIINAVCRIFDVLRRCHIDCTK
ncbi:MAG: hypothetical protein UHD64_09500 [Bacteroidales bacterium]|nr:hypothetical protein [Bacteroidales bacterium]